MAQPEDHGDRTTIYRREDTLPEGTQEEFGHYMVVIGGTGLGRRLRLDAEPITIGRDPSCEMALASPDVSRRHCRLQLVAGEVFVTDLRSTNGTYVDGKKIEDSVLLPDGSIVEIGQQVLKHERRSTREVKEALELDRDLEKARNYVLSLLPSPIVTGTVQAEWFIVPSAKVGGDAFGYGALDNDRFAIYLIDVSGHGVGAAMLSVSILNVLRQLALAGNRFRPAGRGSQPPERHVPDGEPQRHVLHHLVRRLQPAGPFARLLLGRTSSGLCRIARPQELSRR